MKEEIFLCGTSMERSTSNGISSMFQTGLENQAKESSTQTSVSMLKEISTLSLDYQREDTLISSEETWSLRLRTEEDLSSTTSINRLEQSNVDKTTGRSTSKAQEDQPTCNSGAPTPCGGRSSSMMEPSSPTFRTTRYLMLLEEKTMKPKTSKSGARRNTSSEMEGCLH